MVVQKMSLFNTCRNSCVEFHFNVVNLNSDFMFINILFVHHSVTFPKCAFHSHDFVRCYHSPKNMSYDNFEHYLTMNTMFRFMGKILEKYAFKFDSLSSINKSETGDFLWL